MNSPLKYVLARVWNDAKTSVVGGAFLYDERLLVTCAHVVGAAKNVKDDELVDTPPDGPVTLDFPLLSSELYHTALVTFWRTPKPKPQNNELEDIAVLELVEYQHPRWQLAKSCLEINAGNEVTCCGFPIQSQEGVWINGVLAGPNAKGRVQINPKSEFKRLIKRGFSGAPVLDVSSNEVAGIMVTTKRMEKTNFGFLIPSSRIPLHAKSTELFYSCSLVYCEDQGEQMDDYANNLHYSLLYGLNRAGSDSRIAVIKYPAKDRPELANEFASILNKSGSVVLLLTPALFLNRAASKQISAELLRRSGTRSIFPVLLRVGDYGKEISNLLNGEDQSLFDFSNLAGSSLLYGSEADQTKLEQLASKIAQVPRLTATMPEVGGAQVVNSLFELPKIKLPWRSR